MADPYAERGEVTSRRLKDRQSLLRREAEDYLRRQVLDYAPRQATSWQRDYTSLEAFSASVAENRRRWQDAVGVFEDAGTFVVDGPGLVRAVVDDHRCGVDVALVSARFHNGLAAAVHRTCLSIAERTDVWTVALSGGVFANRLLLERTVEALEGSGFTVLTHSRVPCNDGGISFGQAVVAAARDRSSD